MVLNLEAIVDEEYDYSASDRAYLHPTQNIRVPWCSLTA